MPEFKFLKKEDIIKEFTINTQLYFQLQEKRKECNLKTYQDYKKSYDIRTGHYIDGTKINTEYHPLHDYHLVNKKTNVKYFIETVCIQHHKGKYLCLICRKEHTESHAVIDWEDISCYCQITLNNIKYMNNKYEMIKN